MDTSTSGANGSPWRAPSTATLLGAIAAGAILVLAAAWPAGGDAPSVLSAASADTPAGATALPVAASPAQGTGVPDASTAFEGRTTAVEDTAPTF